mgnify:CR=1 FL=1
MQQKYSNYIDVNPLFESVVDIDADQRNPQLWQEYIVGKDMENLIDFLCQSLGNETVDGRRSFWIHGSYGTGKSYAAIFVKHLLEEKAEVIDTFMANHQVLSKYRKRFRKCRCNGDYLVIWKTGCTGIRTGDMMLLEMEKAVRDALVEKFGDDADLGSGSLRDVIITKLNDNMINWSNVLDSTTLGDDYNSIEELRNKVKNGDMKAIQRTAAVIRQQGWGLLDNLDTFKAWISEIIEANGLSKSGIFFIWDEFTEYVNHSDDHTVMQQISEFCKVKPFFMLYVVHRSDEMVVSMGEDRYQLITHRFHTAEFHISVDAAYDLIAGSFGPRTGMDEHWKEERKQVVKAIKKYLPDMEGLDDKISEKIELLCPMHPMTIKLLTRVAESYAAAQRTLFRFMKDTVQKLGFVGYIDKYGPDEEICWLTPEWLWDYFFTRESDFSDKDTKAAEFIRHFEENRHLVECDENTFRVFKVAMLLMTVMSSTKGIYGGVRSQGGISATVECLESCLAGTMSQQLVRDKLDILEDDKILNRDAHGGATRLQLPFKAMTGDEFTNRFKANDKKYSRYQMFAKDGIFSSAFEKRALDENDASSKRIKVAVCCAETLSIKNRLDEIQKELERYPFKLGLLLVTVKDETQALSIHGDLEKLAREGDERLTVALVKTAFTDEKRKEWLSRLTKKELASEGGQTASANGFKLEMEQIVATWVNQAIAGSRITAWNGTQVFNNQYGMAQLRKTIEINVRQKLFPYAPETIVVTSTAYKICTDPAPLAGITKSTNNSQLKSVLTGLKDAGIMDDAQTLSELSQKNETKSAESIAAVARLIKEQMETGQRVILSELWEKLQNRPYGYYDTIACGVLLGFVFSFYKNSAYSWTDNAQSTHVLGESTLKKMVYNICKGKMSTDYLSAGSVTFQNFRDYAKQIFALSDVQVANETECWRNIREAITKSGTPLWAMKFLKDNAYHSVSLKETTIQLINKLQEFVMREGDRESTMSEFLTLMTGHGKCRLILQKAFQDKTVLSTAFRRFLYDSSPDLEAIALKLCLQTESLSDKLHQVMQGAIYTWTEEQVKEKLANVVQEYLYLDTLNEVIGNNCHSIEDAQKELRNLFRFFRISAMAVEKLNPSWYPAMRIMHKVSVDGVMHMTTDEQMADIAVLKQTGKDAMGALMDAKPVLSRILEERGLEYTTEELINIYVGLKELTYETGINQFETSLKNQIARISQARNRRILLAKWNTLTGEDTVKAWCVTHKAPIRWVIPKECEKTIVTLMEVQQDRRVLDQHVVEAINALESLDVALVCDEQVIEDGLLLSIGKENKEVWREDKETILSRARQKLGADMSQWGIPELNAVRGMLSAKVKEKAKKEKLDAAKISVQNMAETALKDRIKIFLEKHPEYCDVFME